MINKFWITLTFFTLLSSSCSETQLTSNKGITTDDVGISDELDGLPEDYVVNELGQIIDPNGNIFDANPLTNDPDYDPSNNPNEPGSTEQDPDGQEPHIQNPNNQNPDDEGSSEVIPLKGSTSLQEDEVSIQIDFTRFPDNAAWNNCMSIKVNDDADVEVGCNKDASHRVTPIVFKEKPFCNVVRMTMTSNGSFNFSTQNADNVRVANNSDEDLRNFEGFKFYKENNNQLLGLVNDNGDRNNASDTTFRLTGLEQINYRIENGENSCN